MPAKQATPPGADKPDTPPQAAPEPVAKETGSGPAQQTLPKAVPAPEQQPVQPKAKSTASGSKHVEKDRAPTMYEDGTYWKQLARMFTYVLSPCKDEELRGGWSQEGLEGQRGCH